MYDTSEGCTCIFVGNGILKVVVQVRIHKVEIVSDQLYAMLLCKM